MRAFSYSPSEDLVRFRVDKKYQALAISTEMPTIGDKIYVLGNSDGLGVVTHLEGSVLGVGPELLEVSARFVQGNSGSPIIDNGGNVLGVATFAFLRRDPQNWLLTNSPFNGIRRFGFRLADVAWNDSDFSDFIREGVRQREEVIQKRAIENTTFRLRALSNKLASFMAEATEYYPAHVVYERVQNTEGCRVRHQDDWGVKIRFVIENNTAVLTSAGPDRHFDTFDDIAFTNKCAYREVVLKEESEKEMARREIALINKRLADIQRARSLSKCLTDVCGFTVGQIVDTRQFVCCTTRNFGSHMIIGEIPFGKGASFGGHPAFKSATVLMSANGEVMMLALIDRNKVSKEYFYDYLKSIELLFGFEFDKKETVSGELFASMDFFDDRTLSVTHTLQGTITVSYSAKTLSREFGQAMEQIVAKEYKNRGCNQDEDFLGIQLGSFFGDILDCLYGKVEHPTEELVRVKFKPRKMFRDFDDYRITFKKANGAIGYVECSKEFENRFVAKEIKELQFALEKKYGLLLLRGTPFEGVDMIWSFSVYKPNHVELSLWKEEFSAFHDEKLVWNYELSLQIGLQVQSVGKGRSRITVSALKSGVLDAEASKMADERQGAWGIDAL